MYKLSKLPNIIIKVSNNHSIPFDVDNVDYQAYLAWVALGNSPAPAQTKAEIDAETIARNNTAILAQLEANDKKVIRALIEGDTVRINATKAAQAALRAQLTPPIP